VLDKGRVLWEDSPNVAKEMKVKCWCGVLHGHAAGWQPKNNGADCTRSESAYIRRNMASRWISMLVGLPRNVCRHTERFVKWFRVT
jgi:hypothetical protein